ncbi:MAG: DNA-processing protein DprA [Bacteroidales bacterium]|nr:DNA-processing protein DprA [Bacteroidales bacterium]
MEEDLKYTIALMNIRGIGSIMARHLIEAFGSAKNVYEADRNLLSNLPRIGQTLIEQLDNPEHIEKAEREIEFTQEHHINTLIYGQEGYPSRLMDCPDAPTLLFYLGDANLESKHILSIVGTRSCTQYGRDMVNKLVSELKEAVPDLLIVSGLALGIDVASHRAALEHHIPTVGVVAHGLDRIYPSSHRATASRMIHEGGGLITEYVTGTEPDRGNFLARNRIIAGLADCILIAESREVGGSLVTASIGVDYGRDVFAFPGRISDDRSKGCNRLIRLNRAGLITCASDLLEAMNWNSTALKPQAIQQSINFEEENLSPLGRQIMDLLQDRGDLRLNQICDLLPHVNRSSLIEELLDLEMNDKIRNCPGGIYQRK